MCLILATAQVVAAVLLLRLLLRRAQKMGVAGVKHWQPLQQRSSKHQMLRLQQKQ